MSVISTTIRDIDEDLYRKFRAACVEKNIKTGEAVTEAIKIWLEKQGKLSKD
jgi:hypothetical protein